MMMRLVIVLLAATLGVNAWANPCATGGRPFPVQDGSGMGGTGLTAGVEDGSGMGGTGHGDGSGAGGTGQQARSSGDGSGMGGTGVVGEITGFGSICVNGLEIHYDAKTPVSVDGQAGKAERLAVGQVVAVHAEGRGANLRASRIQVRHALVGRVEAVNADGRLQVWGQLVTPPLMSRVQSGQRIKVSGYRAEAKHVIASRIDPAANDEPDVVSGEVDWVQGKTAQIGGVRVRLPQGGETFGPGDEVRVSGKAEAGGMRANRVEPEGVRGFLGKVERLSVKDRVRVTSTGKVRVGNAEFSLDAKTRVQGGKVDALRPGQMVHVDARQKEGRLVIERIEIREAADRPEKSESSAVKLQRDQEDEEARESRGGDTAHATRGRAHEAEDAHVEKSERAEKSDRREGGEKIAKAEAVRDRVEKRETPERSERTERTERSEKTERVDRVEKPAKVERPDKVEKPEKIERPEKVEKPEKPERPEKVEKPEKPDKIERPERHEHDH